jgi:hypothetical protein
VGNTKYRNAIKGKQSMSTEAQAQMCCIILAAGEFCFVSLISRLLSKLTHQNYVDVGHQSAVQNEQGILFPTALIPGNGGKAIMTLWWETLSHGRKFKSKFAYFRSGLYLHNKS